MTIARTFRVPNISCAHCVRTIERELGELHGVTSVRADQAKQLVTVEWQESQITWEEIRALLHAINYPPEIE
ncbi:MAG: heavy-metal-associated domain-containing protein [Anaerolineae bacterium]|nr:heavy-metal-associated domain-containing protein [Anaerolineae bacterium]MDW8071384.1 heavy-metal-associated domain-containing protein [Anaerolineae bacterium]